MTQYIAMVVIITLAVLVALTGCKTPMITNNYNSLSQISTNVEAQLVKYNMGTVGALYEPAKYEKNTRAPSYEVRNLLRIYRASMAEAQAIQAANKVEAQTCNQDEPAIVKSVGNTADELIAAIKKDLNE